MFDKIMRTQSFVSQVKVAQYVSYDGAKLKKKMKVNDDCNVASFPLLKGVRGRGSYDLPE